MAPVDARTKVDSIRRNKKKQQKSKSGSVVDGTKRGNVKDLRQIIAKKSKRKNDRSPSRTAQGRIDKQQSNRSNSTPRSRDLRESKLASRRNASQTRDRGSFNEARNKIEQRNSSGRQAPVVNRRRIANTQTVKIGRKIVQQQKYYVPPHMQRDQPTYILSAPPPPPPPPATTALNGRKSNMAMDSLHNDQSGAGGASILISNLSPEATQSDIIEIFGNVGVMTAVNIINQTTALVSYQNSSDAVRAVKFYNNRLLDGKPMLVNMMPNNI